MLRALIFALLISPPLQAMTWAEYLEKFFQNDPELKQAKYELELAEAQAKELHSLNTTLLVLEPNRTESIAQVGQTELDAESFFLTSQVEQKLAYGSLLTFTINDNIAPKELGTGITGRRIENEYSLGLTQSLWNNGLGYADRAQAQAAELNLKSEKAEYQAAHALSCSNALELYSKTFVSQKTFENFQLLQKEAARAFEITRRSYQQRLVRKIDWLTAETDKLQIDSQLIQLKTKRLSDWIEFQKYLKTVSEPTSLEPIPEVEPVAEPPESDKVLSYQAEAAQLLGESREHQLAARKNLEQSDLDFTIEVGQREGSDLTQFGVSEYSEEFIKASVRWAIPLFNPARSARIKQSYSEMMIAQELFNKTKLQDGADRKRLAQELEALKANFALHTAKLDSLVAQLSEARSLLSSGRVEYQDYLAYRNQWFQELIDGLDLQKQIWTTALNLYRLNRQESLICGGSL